MATIRPMGDKFIRVDRAHPPAAMALDRSVSKRLPPIPRESVPAPVRSEASVAEREDLVLICEAESTAINEGNWTFTLESHAGKVIDAASDSDSGDLNRLSLLAAVLGLEAIEGVGRVTMISSNRYLIRSLGSPLQRWRENDFAWQNCGNAMPIQNADLWKRFDRALKFHQVHACLVTAQHVASQDELVSQRPVDRPADAPGAGAVPSHPSRLNAFLRHQAITSQRQGVAQRWDRSDLHASAQTRHETSADAN